MKLDFIRFILFGAFLFLLIGCESSTVYNYSDNSSTMGLSFFPSKVTFYDNSTQELSISYSLGDLLLLDHAIDNVTIDNVSKARFSAVVDVENCLTMISLTGSYVIKLKYADDNFSCPQKNMGNLRLYFRYLGDIDSGRVKEQVIPVTCLPAN